MWLIFLQVPRCGRIAVAREPLLPESQALSLTAQDLCQEFPALPWRCILPPSTSSHCFTAVPAAGSTEHIEPLSMHQTCTPGSPRRHALGLYAPAQSLIRW